MTPRKVLTVVLDTNFLLIPIRFGVDVRAELGRVVEASFVLTVTPAVLEELRRLEDKVKASEAKDIRFALDFASQMKVIDDILAEGEEVDDQLLRLAVERGYIVATTDGGLRRRLREKGLPVVFLRQTRHLAIEGLI
ncbi:MAG: nucleotide-binding protein [Candidatus Bathyarchaeota archaeon]|nr:nucleotide-binding protein [Candidatus Bathyarchaeota archaeon]